jgi:hypothetical protein
MTVPFCVKSFAKWNRIDPMSVCTLDAISGDQIFIVTPLTVA